MTSFRYAFDNNGGRRFFLVEQVANGINGVIGLDGPTDVATSLAGDYMYITNDNGTVAVFERDSETAPAQFVQVVRQNVSGFDGLDRPVSIVTAGEGAMVATAGRANLPATLVNLDAKPIVGGTLSQRAKSDPTNVLVVMDEPFPTEPGRLSSFSYYLPQDSFNDLPPIITPLLLEKVGPDWKIVGVGKNVEAGGPHLQNQQFVLQSGSAQTSGRYFGFRVDLYGESKGVTFSDSATETAIVFSDPGGVSIDQVLTGGSRLARDYSIQATTLQRVKSGAVVVDFENIETLGVSTGSGSGVLTLRDAQGTDVGTTSIQAGAGVDDVRILDISPNTKVDLGAGADKSLIDTIASGTLQLWAGSGEDSVDFRDIGPNSSTSLFGEADRDSFRVEGDELESTNTTTIDGGTPDGVFPGDGLVFDPNGKTVTNPNPQPGSGTVGVVGKGPVNYSAIEDIQQVGAPVITFTPSTPEIFEGDTLNVSVDVDYAGNTSIGNIEWDLDNDGVFAEPDEPSGTSQNLTWQQLLIAAGIKDDGLYTIAVRATNTVGTTTRFRTLTVKNTAPTIGDLPDVPVTVGTELTIPLSTTDPGDDRIMGWEILWGVADPNSPGNSIKSKLGPDAKSASFTYQEPGTYILIVNVFDDDSGQDLIASQTAWLFTTDIDTVPHSGPYEIMEGQDLVVSATPYGHPTSIAWNAVGGDAELNTASGTITWDTLQN
ncbi:MAG: hypothetical protein MI861_26455, partial [Pirellulales bacterium]|nr:hypothetical protein [Pirellulales bacterium]